MPTQPHTNNIMSAPTRTKQEESLVQFGDANSKCTTLMMPLICTENTLLKIHFAFEKLQTVR